MKASKLFQFINEILRQEGVKDCNISFDNIMSPKHNYDNIDIMTIQVNGKYLQYTTDFKEYKP